jgi:hypothetical protein
MIGTPQLINTGNALMPAAVSPMGGVKPLGNNIPLQLAPNEKVWNPKLQRYEFMGSAPQGTPTPVFENPGDDIAPPPSEPIPEGANIGTNLNQRDQNMTSSGLPPSLPAGPSLGQPEAAAVTGKASAEQGVSLQQTADNVPQRKALLGQMEGALKDFNSGPGADQWKTILAGTNRLFGTNSDRVAGQEEFDKLATQLAQQQFQALGGTGTDDKLDSARKASPSSFLSNYGNQKIIALLKGNEDAIAAKNQAWQQWQEVNGPESFGQFSTQFNKNYDPRAFQLQYMAPKEIKSMLSGMNKTERTKFRETVNSAVENGWIPDKRQTNAN